MNRPDLRGVFLTVISHRRPGNVARMAALVGAATWIVGCGEAEEYRAAGARSVVECGGLCESRNLALEMAEDQGAVCIQVSDDLTKVQRAVRDATGLKVVAVDSTFAEVVGMALDALESTGAHLAGAAPTSNPFYANVDRPIHTSAFIVGDFMVVRPDAGLRFDTSLMLKEDYDFTLSHITKLGSVARRDDVLLTFLHRNNPGGAVAVRTAELEQACIAHLKAKWPAFIRDNPRRPNEILLNLPRRGKK